MIMIIILELMQIIARSVRLDELEMNGKKKNKNKKTSSMNSGIQMILTMTCNVIEILVAFVKMTDRVMIVIILIMKIMKMMNVIITLTRTILNVLLMNFIILFIMEMIITRKIT